MWNYTLIVSERTGFSNHNIPIENFDFVSDPCKGDHYLIIHVKHEQNTIAFFESLIYTKFQIGLVINNSAYAIYQVEGLIVRDVELKQGIVYIYFLYDSMIDNVTKEKQKRNEQDRIEKARRLRKIEEYKKAAAEQFTKLPSIIKAHIYLDQDGIKDYGKGEYDDI